MRTTKATNAISRLKKRTGDEGYSLALGANGLLSLLLHRDDGEIERLCEPMELDDFVRFVDGLGPQQVRKVSALDVAFEKQLRKKNDPS